MHEPRRDDIHTSLSALVRLRFAARGFSYLPRQPVRSILSGRKRSRLRGRGLDFDELRHYRPGDDIRTMDWRVTNRTGKPHVRVYTEERDRPVIARVDQRMPMFFGSKKKMKSVIAAEVAALTAWRVLSASDRIGAIIFNDETIIEAKPSRSVERRSDLLDPHGVARRLQARDRPAAAPGRAPRPQVDVLIVRFRRRRRRAHARYRQLREAGARVETRGAPV